MNFVAFTKKILSDILKRDGSVNLKLLNDPKYILGFSEIQITQTIDHAEKPFTIDDICKYIDIWYLKHAHKVYNI